MLGLMWEHYELWTNQKSSHAGRPSPPPHRIHSNVSHAAATLGGDLDIVLSNHAQGLVMIDHQFSGKDQHLTYFFELVQA
jgi:hypothetical protein